MDEDTPFVWTEMTEQLAMHLCKGNVDDSLYLKMYNKLAHRELTGRFPSPWDAE